MPLHRLFVPKGLYTPSDKVALAQAITTVYQLIPKFYVVVLFIELESKDFFVGGNTTDRMVRISVEHLARNFSECVICISLPSLYCLLLIYRLAAHSDAAKRGFMDRYETALAPFTKARGIDWEVQVTDCDRLLWNINGMAPPQGNSEEEKIWKRENRAVTAEEMEVLKRRL
ncbi:Tautomerase-3 domain-containing protein [Mycena sanguinolenta]|uniref:Tautomerase-3 domain-containing protein n=1 Tax=Mycena sanguinolenta TaxID=230812 RepID=A0A8H6YF00_9AGAR|nr:Tautomerase-3 domain-containing protein [Mycena sanguinolenta]